MASEAFGSNYSVNWAGGMEAPTRAKEHLLQDLKKMDQGNLGLTAAQKQQMGQTAQQAAAQQGAAQQTALRRKQLAEGGGFSGYGAEASRQIAAGTGEAGAQVTQQVEALSGEMAQAQATEIRGRLERQQERKRDNDRYWAQFALDANESMAAIAAMGGEIYGDFAGGGM